MSNNLKAKIAQVECPECGARSEFEAWPVVPNVFLPEVAESLREGSLFKYECDACGYKDIVPYQCLYHDIPHEKLVLLQPIPAKRAEAEAELARLTRRDGDGASVDAAGGNSVEVMASGDPVEPTASGSPSQPSSIPRHIGRLVFHPSRLAEKARIFEAGLDDCAIELMKFKMKEQLVGDDPLFETMEFFFEEADDAFFTFYGSGCEDGALTALRALYDQAVIDLMAHPPQDDAFVVDERWAQRYLQDAVLAEAESL